LNLSTIATRGVKIGVMKSLNFILFSCELMLF
jgi:hypothetical protein